MLRLQATGAVTEWAAVQLELMLQRQVCAASLLSWASKGRGRALGVLMCGLAGASLLGTVWCIHGESFNAAAVALKHSHSAAGGPDINAVWVGGSS